MDPMADLVLRSPVLGSRAGSPHVGDHWHWARECVDRTESLLSRALHDEAPTSESENLKNHQSEPGSRRQACGRRIRGR